MQGFRKAQYTWYAVLVGVCFLASVGYKLWEYNQWKVVQRQALAAYEKKEYGTAYDLIHPLQAALEPHGCALLISVYAEMKKTEELFGVASRCLERGVAVELAYEAIAMSLSQAKQTDQAITFLTAHSPSPTLARWHGALAALYVFTENYPQARQHYVLGWTAIGHNEILHKQWLKRILRNQPLSSDKDFLTTLAALISRQPFDDQNLMEIFVAKVQEMQLPEIAKMLTPYTKETGHE